ncbi:MAG: hypothetical protein SH817_08670 [Leptospira sp.]|nr:hypothetical protein [Leptospira sp.]
MLKERKVRAVNIGREEVFYFYLDMEIPFLGKFEIKLSNPDIRRYAVTHLDEDKSLIMRFNTYEEAENWCGEMGYEVDDRW